MVWAFFTEVIMWPFAHGEARPAQAQLCFRLPVLFPPPRAGCPPALIELTPPTRLQVPLFTDQLGPLWGFMQLQAPLPDRISHSSLLTRL